MNTLPSESRSTEPLPFFTVIVPTRNRPVRLHSCIASIAAIDYPSDRFEVIVVNDGGEDASAAINAGKRTIRVRILNVPHRGPAIARNAGLEAAEGRYVAFTDDDCTVSEQWLLAYAKGFGDHPGAMLGGPVVNALPDNPFASTSQLLIDYLYGYFNRAPGNATFLTSNNIAIGRDELRAAGGFDPIFVRAAGEDRDLCARWSHSGRPAWFIENARVDHAHEMGLTGFVRQHFGYGRGANFFRILEAKRGVGRIRVEPITFYTNMIAAPWRRRGPVLATATSLLLVLSQTANAMGYFWERLVASRIEGRSGD